MAIKVPIIKKGPNGRASFIPFFFDSKKPTATKDPKINARYKDTRSPTPPKKNPIKIPSFRSPKPIPLPFVKSITKPKKPPPTKAKRILYKKP